MSGVTTHYPPSQANSNLNFLLILLGLMTWLLMLECLTLLQHWLFMGLVTPNWHLEDEVL